MTKKPKLGDRARDVITGFEGIVICHSKWLTGCDVYGIAPDKTDKDGKPMRSEHFDIDRVEVIERNAVKLVGNKSIKESRVTGGPSSLDSQPTEQNR